MPYDRALVADKLRRWEKYLNHFMLPQWEDIPDFGLYMEQVIALLKQYLDYLPPELREEQLITAATINNYVRTKVMPVPHKRKYYRVHIAYLIIIMTLKQSLSIALIKKLIPTGIPEAEAASVYRAYAARHRLAAQYFTEQVRLAAAGILSPDSASEQATDQTADLITSSAVIAGFARLLSQKLLLLEDKPQESAKKPG